MYNVAINTGLLLSLIKTKVIALQGIGMNGLSCLMADKIITHKFDTWRVIMANNIGPIIVSDKSTAEDISKIMLEVCGLLNESAKVMADSKCSDDEKSTYYKLAGQLLGVIGLDVLHVIYCAYPDIKPKDWI
jgi:hypothetical protein